MGKIIMGKDQESFAVRPNEGLMPTEAELHAAMMVCYDALSKQSQDECEPSKNENIDYKEKWETAVRQKINTEKLMWEYKEQLEKTGLIPKPFIENQDHN